MRVVEGTTAAKSVKQHFYSQKPEYCPRQRIARGCPAVSDFEFRSGIEGESCFLLYSDSLQYAVCIRTATDDRLQPSISLSIILSSNQLLSRFFLYD